MENRFKKELDTFKKLGLLNPLNLTKEDDRSFQVKYSVRAVIVLNNNKIILIKAENGKYHTIVGGEVDEGEDLESAVIRECREESGYNIQIVNPLGWLEFLKKNGRRFDFGYIVKAVGEQGSLELTELEVNLGHECLECSIFEAIAILKKETDHGSYISERSLIFLKEAQKYLENVLK